MALDPQALSITSVFNSIVSYFRSKENQTKLKDFSNNSEASFIIRMLSNVVSAISYRIVAQSRENFLTTATLPASTTGIAVNLGYSTFRGQNLRRRIKIYPTGNYTYPKLSVIGTYTDEYDIITLEEVALKEGEEKEIDVVVGKIKEETLTAGTSAVKVFSLFSTGISEDYVLYVDSTEVPTTKVIKELVDDKYLVRTNPYGSVDIVYLNTYPNFKYKYGTGTEFTVRYVILENMTVQQFTTDMFTCGTLEDQTTISTYLPVETVDEVKVNAPLDHELQNLIRSKADYANRMKELIPLVKEANFKALTPTYTLISYLKNNLTLLTSNEEAQVETILKQENFFGTPLPDITVPRREVAKLQIDMTLTNKYKNISDINLDIENILDNYYDYTLGLDFSVYDLERKLESLSYVKYVRVRHVINERVTGANYQIGYILEKDGSYYIASKILGSSGSGEPNWNIPTERIQAIDTGLETVDGNIIWRAYKRLPNMDSLTLSLWEAGFPYGLGDYVYSNNFPMYMFKCVDLIKSSSASAPDATYRVTGDFIVDGSLVWVVKDREVAESWKSLYNYRLGSTVNVPSNQEVSLECVSYTGTTGTDKQLDFELASYPIVSKTSSSFSIAGKKTFYIRPGDIISVVSPSGYTNFSVTDCSYSNVTSQTTITVAQVIDTSIDYSYIVTEDRGTRDGQILWSLIDDIDNIKYNWNSYTTFSYNLNIID